MVDKFVLEGWIRAKLDYSQSTGFIADINQFYFDTHTRFGFVDENKSNRIKFLQFTDKEENIMYLVTFGYDQIGIRFTIVTRKESANVKDRISIFQSSLSRAIKGYRNFKKYFSSKICPKSMEIQFAPRAQSLLLSLYGFFEELSTKQRNSLLEKMKSVLKEYTADVRFVLTSEKLIGPSDEKELRALTMTELEKLSRFDFGTILVICGRIYLFVDHHLFGTHFILEDPSLSLITVAEWGFISSLKLQDLHYEIKDYYGKMKKLKTNLEEMRRSCVPHGLDIRREDLIDLEKSQVNIESDLKEFTNLSKKIYDGINSNEQSKQVWSVMRTMESLPHSLFQAYGILKMEELGRFLGFKRDLPNLSSELKKLEMKFKKAELYITVLALFALLLVVPTIVYALKFDIGYIANIFQILTFGVALILLVLRFWPKS